jgi:hypothetical protein
VRGASNSSRHRSAPDGRAGNGDCPGVHRDPLEFRSFAEPIAIVVSAVLSPFETLLALWVTGTSLNDVSFLGAIIGII